MAKRVLTGDDHNEDISDSTDDEFSDETYKISNDDLRDEKEDQLEDGEGVSNEPERNQRSKKNANPQKRAKRLCTEKGVDRFGRTEDSVDHNSFFGALVTTSTETNNSLESNMLDTSFGISDKPIAATSNSQSTESLLKLLIATVKALQEQMIRMEVKLDNIADIYTKSPTGLLDMEKLNKTGLPVKNLNGLESLENSLDDHLKRNEILNILTEIGGTKGNADGTKIIESIFHTIITPAFSPDISWTGRGRGKEEKIALSKYSNITNVIAEVMQKADRRFDQLKTLNCLKYKVLKRAPGKFGLKPKSDSKEVGDKNVTVMETVECRNTVPSPAQFNETASCSSSDSSTVTPAPSCTLPRANQNQNQLLAGAPFSQPNAVVISQPSHVPQQNTAPFTNTNSTNYMWNMPNLFYEKMFREFVLDRGIPPDWSKP